MGSPQDASRDVALSRLYFLLLGASGAWVPYLALYLQQQGLDAAAVGRVMVGMGLARVVAGPLWGVLADTVRRDRWLLSAGTAVTSAVGLAALGSPIGAISAVLAAHALFRAPLGALLDATAIRSLTASGKPESYGRLRLWGSLGYLAFSAVGGWLAGAGAATALLLAVVAWAVTAALAWRAAGDQAVPVANPLPAMRAAFRSPRLAVLLSAAVLHGAALGAYDTLYGVHLAARGHAASWTGAAIAAGVLTEVFVLHRSPMLLRRFGPWALVAVAMAAGALRWSATREIEGALPLTLVQASHGVVFGAFWVGLVEASRRLTPDSLRASVAALLVAATYGVGPALCGWVTALVAAEGGTDRVFELGAMASAAAAAMVWFARPR
jgi:PPP family 3-phenylpropionic acid transporter